MQRLVQPVTSVAMMAMLTKLVGSMMGGLSFQEKDAPRSSQKKPRLTSQQDYINPRWESFIPPGRFGYRTLSEPMKDEVLRMVQEYRWMDTLPPQWLQFSRSEEKSLQLTFNTEYLPKTSMLQVIEVSLSAPPGWGNVQIWNTFPKRKITIVLSYMRPGEEVPWNDILPEFCTACGRAEIYSLALKRKFTLPDEILPLIRMKDRPPRNTPSTRWFTGSNVGGATLIYLGDVRGKHWAHVFGCEGVYEEYVEERIVTDLEMIQGVVRVDEFGDKLVTRVYEASAQGRAIERGLDEILRDFE